MLNMSSQGGGHLYMQTNEIRNCIVHYRRAADAAIREMERTATGGAGLGTFKPISGRMKLTWYGHSAFRIEGGAAKILIDPLLSDNPSWDKVQGWIGSPAGEDSTQGGGR